MKAEIKNRWVEALRSGEYKQGLGRLRSKEGRYCCLGVLCDLHAKDTGTEWRSCSDLPSFGYLGMSGALPDEVEVWADAQLDAWRESKVIRLNDSGSSFTDIADFIEAQWPVTNQGNTWGASNWQFRSEKVKFFYFFADRALMVV